MRLRVMSGQHVLSSERHQCKTNCTVVFPDSLEGMVAYSSEARKENAKSREVGCHCREPMKKWKEQLGKPCLKWTCIIKTWQKWMKKRSLRESALRRLLRKSNSWSSGLGRCTLAFLNDFLVCSVGTSNTSVKCSANDV